MTEILTRMTVSVKTLSPIHIGTGEKLGRFDYLLKDGNFIFLDENKFTRWLAQPENINYANKLMEVIEQKRRISDFLKESNAPLDALKAYQIPINVRKDADIKNIQPFIKDIHHQPFIPGSSLKGSLRSALLRGVMLENTSKRNEIARIVYQQALRGQSASEEVQASFFVPGTRNRSEYSNYDVNRLLALGDSNSKTADSLELVEVKVYSSGRNTLIPKPFSSYLEVLKPGVTLNFPLTWLPYLLQNHASNLRFEDVQRFMIYLPEFCRAASLNILAQEIEYFGSHGEPGLTKWFESQREKILKSANDVLFFLPIGWGSGYDAKTITDLLGEQTFEAVAEHCNNMEGLGRPGNTHSSKWLGLKESPKSRKLVLCPNDKEYPLKPLGWVWGVFKPLNNDDPIDAGENWWMQARKTSEASKPVFTTVINENTGTAQVPIASAVPPSKSPSVVSPLKVQSKPETEKIAIIETFDACPNVGDRFEGEMFDENEQGILLTIPGLEDTEAYALISPENNKSGKKYREGKNLLSEVISVESDGKTKRVRCRCE